jgi:hypothetical protein
MPMASQSHSLVIFSSISMKHTLSCAVHSKKRDMKKNKSRRLQSIIKMPTMLIKININAALSKNSGMVWRLLLSLGMCKKVLCCGSYFLQRSPTRVAPRSGDSGETAAVPPSPTSPCPRSRGRLEKTVRPPGMAEAGPSRSGLPVARPGGGWAAAALAAPAASGGSAPSTVRSGGWGVGSAAHHHPREVPHSFSSIPALFLRLPPWMLPRGDRRPRAGAAQI